MTDWLEPAYVRGRGVTEPPTPYQRASVVAELKFEFNRVSSFVIWFAMFATD